MSDNVAYGCFAIIFVIEAIIFMWKLYDYINRDNMDFDAYNPITWKRASHSVIKYDKSALEKDKNYFKQMGDYITTRLKTDSKSLWDNADAFIKQKYNLNNSKS